MQAEGYTQITLSRTLLGRRRIVATGPAGLREVVVHLSTDEVLRDAFTASTEDDDDSRGGGRGRGRGSDDGDGSDVGDNGDDSGGDDD